MGGKALFGRYWKADSPLHRLDPRTKLLGTLALVAIVFMAGNFYGLGLLAAAILGLFALGRIPLSQALRSIAPLSFIIALTALFNLFFVRGGGTVIDWGWLAIDSTGIRSALFVGLRLTLLLLAGSLLTLTTPSLDITEAMERLLSPLARWGFPAHEFAFVMGLALRFLPQFVDEFRDIRTAQIARGASLATSPFRSGPSALSCLIVPLFASVFRHADTLSAAMDSRCYHGSRGRTRLHPLRFASRDRMAALALAALAGGVVALSLL